MNGSVRRRGDVWEYVVDLGRRSRWICPTGGCRWGTWDGVAGRDGCPDHRDVERVERRRQLLRSGYRRQRDACDAMRQVLADVNGSGGVVAPAQLTVGEYLVDEWLPAVSTTVKPTTLAQYRQMVTVHVVARLGPVVLRDLEPAHLDRLYAELLTSGRRDGGPLSPKTVRHVHVVLRKALGDAVRKGRATRNVAEVASPPRPGAAPLRMWDLDQLQAFHPSPADTVSRPRGRCSPRRA